MMRTIKITSAVIRVLLETGREMNTWEILERVMGNNFRHTGSGKSIGRSLSMASGVIKKSGQRRYPRPAGSNLMNLWELNYDYIHDSICRDIPSCEHSLRCIMNFLKEGKVECIKRRKTKES